MNIEENFALLQKSLLNIYKNALMRRFFFNFLNIHYETTIFKAQPTLGKLKPQEKGQKEEVKIDTKVEEALETAKKVWSGATPLEPKKTSGLKRPTEMKKPTEIKKPEPKKPAETKRPEPRGMALKKPVLAHTEVVLSNINPMDTYSIVSILVNPEFMEKFMDLKSRFNSSLGTGLGGMTQGKKGEAAARKNFMTKLNKKFTSKNIRTEIDTSVCHTYAASKVLNEMSLIICDEEVVQTFFSLASQPASDFSKRDQRHQLFKASFIMNWVEKCLSSLRKTDISQGVKYSKEFRETVNQGRGEIENIEKLDGFPIEKAILGEMLGSCTPEEFQNLIDGHEKLEKYKLNQEVHKFIQNSLSSTKSLPGLRVLHSLGCKQGRFFCTFTQAGTC